MLLTLHEQDSILYANKSGHVSLAEVLRLWKDVLDACAERNLQKTLVDCLGLQGTLTTVERYEVGFWCVNYAAELGINPWVAIVGVPPAVDGLGTLVANNRGARVMVFAEGQPALAWLTSLRMELPAEACR